MQQSQRNPSPQTFTIPADAVSVVDYTRYAQERMHPLAWAYMAGAAGEEQTQALNEAAFARYPLRSRVLRNTAGGHCRLTVFGHEYVSPIFLAPAAAHKLCHPDGELATVLGATAIGCGAVISTQASVDMQLLVEQAKQGNNPLWFQLYIQEDPVYTDALIKKAESASYQALVITVDAPVNGLRYREQRMGFSVPDFAKPVNLHDLPRSCANRRTVQGSDSRDVKHQTSEDSETGIDAAVARDEALTEGSSQTSEATHLRAGQGTVFDSPMVSSALGWDELERVISATSLPVILKGILHPDDAIEGLKRGAAGIMVSNHGGRVLDGMVSSLDCLAEVAQAVKAYKPDVPVFFDGGIRSGSDILKALALGADAIMIARPYLYGLAVGGASGVAHILHLLKTELEMAMVLCGCRTLADVDKSLIHSL
ncbi:MAG: alpha-hydroxy acid oxidase [Pelistega sp.]|nr:alpha-hydroxy acid oxidase [Pelistega sp.]